MGATESHPLDRKGAAVAAVAAWHLVPDDDLAHRGAKHDPRFRFL